MSTFPLAFTTNKVYYRIRYRKKGSNRVYTYARYPTDSDLRAHQHHAFLSCAIVLGAVDVWMEKTEVLTRTTPLQK